MNSGAAKCRFLFIFIAILMTGSATADFRCTVGKVEKGIVNWRTGDTEVSAAAPRYQIWELKKSYDGWAVFTSGLKDPRFKPCKREFETDSGFLVGISCAMNEDAFDPKSKLFYSPEGIFAVHIWSLPAGDYQTVTTIHGRCTG